jgi:hypothetical protein
MSHAFCPAEEETGDDDHAGGVRAEEEDDGAGDLVLGGPAAQGHLLQERSFDLRTALVGLAGHIAYGSSKAAMDNITRVSALELGEHSTQAGLAGHVHDRSAAACADHLARGVLGDQQGAACVEETGARPLPFELTEEDSIRMAIEGRDLDGVVNCGRGSSRARRTW